MKRYNYYYYGQTISREIFIKNVPADWENEINELGEYSYGGYKAMPVD